MRMACQHLLRLQKSRPWSLGGFIRALNSPGSGMSDAHRPVYWLRGSSRHAPPSQENSQWLQPFLRLRGACARRLQLQGQPSSRPCGPRCVPVEPSRAPARYSEPPKRLATVSVLRDGTAVKIRFRWKSTARIASQPPNVDVLSRQHSLQPRSRHDKNMSPFPQQRGRGTEDAVRLLLGKVNVTAIFAIARRRLVRFPTFTRDAILALGLSFIWRTGATPW
jgi:hypothetical protein